MEAITISISPATKNLIVAALLDSEHASGGSGRYQHLRWDVRPDGSLREFWDGNGWHVSDAVATLSPRDFLDTSNGNSFGWGEDVPEGEEDADEEAARDWIASNLLDKIELEGDGESREPLSFAVAYEVEA